MKKEEGMGCRRLLSRNGNVPKEGTYVIVYWAAKSI